jgi:hypothetical protein
MTRIIAAALLALALTAPAKAQAPDPQDICGALGGLAETVMTIRQNGASMSSAMSVQAQIAEEGIVRDLVGAMIRDAYAQPRWNSDMTRRRAVEDFRNAVELSCYNSEWYQ